MATDRINDLGRYLVRAKPSTNTIRRYRVVMPATAAHARGVSPMRTVKVYAWSNLTLRPPANESNFETVASVSMGGMVYPASLEARSILNPDVPSSGTVEFDLGRRCIQFRGTFGLSDNSDEGGEAWLEASADGVDFYKEATAAHKRQIAVGFATPPLKVRFDTESIWDSPGPLHPLDRDIRCAAFPSEPEPGPGPVAPLAAHSHRHVATGQRHERTLLRLRQERPAKKLLPPRPNSSAMLVR